MNKRNELVGMIFKGLFSLAKTKMYFINDKNDPKAANEWTNYLSKKLTSNEMEEDFIAWEISKSCMFPLLIDDYQVLF